MKNQKRGRMSTLGAIALAIVLALGVWLGANTARGDDLEDATATMAATERPAESTEEPAQEADEQSSEVTEPEKAEVVEEAPPAAEAPDVTEEVVSDDVATETSDDSDAAADKAAADEKVEQAAKVDDKAEAKEAAVGKTTKKEEPKKTSAPEPKASPSPSVGGKPTDADLGVSCTDGLLSVTNAHSSWRLRMHIAYYLVEDEETSIGRIDLVPGQLRTVDVSMVPAGVSVRWGVSWFSPTDDYVERYGSIDCSDSPDPDPSPTPTEQPEPRPVDVGRDSKTGLVTATNPEGNPPVVIVVRDKDDKELERVSLEPGETGTVGTDRCEEVSIGVIVSDADEQFWGEFPAEDCTPVPSPSPTPTETVKPSPTPTPEPTAPEPTPSATPTPTQEPTRPVTPKPSPTTEPTATPSERPTAEPTSDKDGGSKDKGKKGAKPKLPKSGVSDDDPIVAIFGATMLAVVVSAGGLVLWRRRA